MGLFTGKGEGRGAVATAGYGVELRLHSLEELHGLLDWPRQLLPVLGQHVAVRLLHAGGISLAQGVSYSS